MSKPILVGAVVYDPKVVLIWEIIAEYFRQHGCPLDTVFYNNYELMVESHLQGQFQIAWNSPLAWLDMQRRTGGDCRGIAMRDTDQDRISHLVVRADSGIRSVADLRGRRVGLGAWDSPQATLIPLQTLAEAGLVEGRDFTASRFDVLVGKHGDHVGGERDALLALQSGDVEAAALLDLNWQAWCADGSLDSAAFRVLLSTEPFDHCIFTVRGDFPLEQQQAWLEVLFGMDYSDPAQREMMDMEGLKEWRPGRQSGFGPLGRAVDTLRFFERRAAGEWSRA
ncbi:MAG: phosphate/phosphite/phosphonate ABC transporter substrate-binding protein [Candidatus Delongbacteria bacterium]